MNIKSLLLGSAAALVAVSGARAADAVTVAAEPEPMEYVRICDTYGAGFYYIPGTETCLKVSGYVRYDIGVGFKGTDTDGTSFTAGGDGDADSYSKRARADIRFDARTETELGTLRSYIEGQFNWDNNRATFFGENANGDLVGNSNTSLAAAYITLGGFKVGKDDSFWDVVTDYGGGTISWDDISPGPYDTNQIGYTFDAGNGFMAGVSLEEGAGGGQIDSYVPHIVVGGSYTQGWGMVALAGAYDSNTENFAVRGKVKVNASEAVSLYVMGAWENDPTWYGSGWGGSWGIWGGVSAKVSDKATVNLDAAYDDAEDFHVSANVAYEVVPGFTVTPEVIYTDNFDGDNDGDWGGIVRFQRNF